MNDLKSYGAIPRFSRNLGIMVVLSLCMIAASCGKTPPPEPPASRAAATPPPPAVPAGPSEMAPLQQPPLETSPPPPSVPPPAPAPVVVPAGTRITIRLDATLGSKTNKVGDQFSATVAKVVRVKGADVLGPQTTVTGEIIDAKAAGKFAGDSSLGLRLDTIAGHHVLATAYSRHVEGKGQRSAAVIGGTTIAGALLGGLAGHGRGALIGGVAGGGVGTLGAAETGNNRDIVLPAGSVLTFNLTKALTLRSTSTSTLPASAASSPSPSAQGPPPVPAVPTPAGQ